eukprot:COSAG01_NODE_2406_length_7755_cov_316.703892_6_plen_147_part_00
MQIAAIFQIPAKICWTQKILLSHQKDTESWYVLAKGDSKTSVAATSANQRVDSGAPALDTRYSELGSDPCPNSCTYIVHCDIRNPPPVTAKWGTLEGATGSQFSHSGELPPSPPPTPASSDTNLWRATIVNLPSPAGGEGKSLLTC